MKDWLDSLEARAKAQAKYDRGHTKGFYIKLNLRTDTDIIRWFWMQPSKQGAVKKLIREEIARRHAGEPGGGMLRLPDSQPDGFRQSPMLSGNTEA